MFVRQFVWTKFGVPSRNEPTKLSFAPNPRTTTKFDPNIYLINNFLHCDFNFLCCTIQKFHFESHLGRTILGSLTLKRPPNLVQTIVSQTTLYIMNFNFLCSTGGLLNLVQPIKIFI